MLAVGSRAGAEEALVRICDPAGRLRGAAFAADDRGTLITSHEAVDGLPGIVLHLPVGAAVGKPSGWTDDDGAPDARATPGDASSTAAGQAAPADDFTYAVDASDIVLLPEAGLALIRTRDLQVPTLPLSTRAYGALEPGTYVHFHARGWREARVLAAHDSVVYEATAGRREIGAVLELAVGTDGSDALRRGGGATGGPVIDTRTGAVLGILGTALRAEHGSAAGFAVHLASAAAAERPEGPLTAVLRRNEVAVPAHGDDLNLAAVLQLAATSVGSEGPRDGACAGDAVERPALEREFGRFLQGGGAVGGWGDAVSRAGFSGRGAVSGPPQVLALVGDPGSGRTTALASLAARRASGAEPAPTLWLRGATLRGGDSSVADAVARALGEAGRIVAASGEYVAGGAGSGTADERTSAVPGGVRGAHGPGRPAGATSDERGAGAAGSGAADNGPLGDIGPERVARLARDAGRPLLVVLDCPEEMPPGLAHRLAEWTAGTADWLRATGARMIVACRGAYWEQAGTHLPADLLYGRDPRLPGCVRIGDLTGEQAARARARFGVPDNALGPADAGHPLTLRLVAELRGALPDGFSGRPARDDVFAAYLDLMCLRVAVRLAAPRGLRGTAVTRLAAKVAGQVHEAARRCLGPGQGELDRAGFESVFPWSSGLASAVLTEGLLVPAGDGYRFAHEEFADWMQGTHLDLDAALWALVHRVVRDTDAASAASRDHGEGLDGRARAAEGSAAVTERERFVPRQGGGRAGRGSARRRSAGRGAGVRTEGPRAESPAAEPRAGRARAETASPRLSAARGGPPVPRHRIGPVVQALLRLDRQGGAAEVARRLAELVRVCQYFERIGVGAPRSDEAAGSPGGRAGGAVAGSRESAERGPRGTAAGDVTAAYAAGREAASGAEGVRGRGMSGAVVAGEHTDGVDADRGPWAAGAPGASRADRQVAVETAAPGGADGSGRASGAGSAGLEDDTAASQQRAALARDAAAADAVWWAAQLTAEVLTRVPDAGPYSPVLRLLVERVGDTGVLPRTGRGDDWAGEPAGSSRVRQGTGPIGLERHGAEAVPAQSPGNTRTCPDDADEVSGGAAQAAEESGAASASVDPLGWPRESTEPAPAGASWGIGPYGAAPTTGTNRTVDVLPATEQPQDAARPHPQAPDHAPVGPGATDGHAAGRRPFDTFGVWFWRGLALPAVERMELLRCLVVADGGRGDERFLDGVAEWLRDEPRVVQPLLTGWFGDRRALRSAPEATVERAAQALLHTHRHGAIDDLMEALVGCAHPLGDELLGALAEDEPSAMCRAVDRWAHDQRPERRVAAAAYGLRAAPGARSEADHSLLRYAALALLARPADCTLHGSALALLVRDPVSRDRYLELALTRFEAGDPQVTAAAVAAALPTHPDPVLAAFRRRLAEPGPVPGDLLRTLAAVTTPPLARRVAVLVRDFLAVRPEAAGEAAVYIDACLEQGRHARVVLHPLVSGLIGSAPVRIRTALARVLADPGTPASEELRGELLDLLLDTEQDPDVLDAVLCALAARRAGRSGAATRGLVRRTGLLLVRTPEGAGRFDRRLVDLARVDDDLARTVAGWMAETPGEWAALIGPSARRMIANLAGAGEDPASVTDGVAGRPAVV
ncbi:hypothetical protein DSC45_33955 [Streptomyces sp. YIM 130001]|uniref:hypothetical protein n=1 Tax=Streptomyces sp. YIM 130001 TaxID=2259644 RepID=UPI000EC047B8|nr:hypothetical protein [Streptomyces sp. YIM 130001]RII08004.1 hypothetical protein DSC45_33955 [Streptomyces sp. YIM 130001]